MSSRRSISFAVLIAGLAALVSSAATAQDSIWVRQLPHVTSIYTIPRHPTAFEETRLVLEGTPPGMCGYFEGGHLVSLNEVALTLVSPRICRDPIRDPWRAEFNFGILPAGVHQIQIALTVRHIAVTDSSDTSFTYRTYHTIVVGDSIPTNPLPFVDTILIGPKRNTRPWDNVICPNDSIIVSFAGRFPDDCHSLRRIEVVDLPYGSPLPHPPLIRLIVEDQPCTRRPCTLVVTPWSAAVVLPPLPRGRYEQIVQLGVVSCPDSTPSDSLFHRTQVPFAVQDCGGDDDACFVHGWARSGIGCNDYVSPSHPAHVTMTLCSRTALAGLQGVITVGFAGALRITEITPVGFAAGMRIQWARNREGGANFVMFSESGAPIPPTCSNLYGAPPQPIPILQLTLEQTGPTAPRATSIMVRDLLGSDIEGRAVHHCPVITLNIIEALVCADLACDFNADGRTDVRDIVLMAHCVVQGDSAGNTYRPLCADSTRVADCNQDGRRDLEDVICCAMRILRHGICPDCPDSSGSRPAPEVAVALDAPVVQGRTIEVPIRVTGASSIGGAILDVRYPSDRYDVALVADDPAWLALATTSGGVATIGLVRLGGPEAVADPAMRLRLTLKPGMSHGGDVAVSRGEFSGADGVRLEVDLGQPAVSIGGSALLAIGEARPNPFSGSTEFVIRLDRDALVDLGVYDLGGRRVATIHRGTLGAGNHPFTWRGVRDDGASAPSGIYFLRGRSGATESSRKVVVLGR